MKRESSLTSVSCPLFQIARISEIQVIASFLKNFTAHEMKLMQYWLFGLLSAFPPKTGWAEPFHCTSPFPQNKPANLQKKTAFHKPHRFHCGQSADHWHPVQLHPPLSAAHKTISTAGPNPDRDFPLRLTVFPRERCQQSHNQKNRLQAPSDQTLLQPVMPA